MKFLFYLFYKFFLNMCTLSYLKLCTVFGTVVYLTSFHNAQALSY